MFSAKWSHEIRVRLQRERLKRRIEKVRRQNHFTLFVKGNILPETQQWLEIMGCECIYMPLKKPGWEIMLK